MWGEGGRVGSGRRGGVRGVGRTRFPAHFIDDIVALLSMLTKDIVDRYQQVGGAVWGEGGRAGTGRRGGVRGGGVGKTRFPAHFIDDIVALLSMLTKDIVDRYQQVGGGGVGWGREGRAR